MIWIALIANEKKLSYKIKCSSVTVFFFHQSDHKYYRTVLQNQFIDGFCWGSILFSNNNANFTILTSFFFFKNVTDFVIASALKNLSLPRTPFHRIIRYLELCLLSKRLTLCHCNRKWDKRWKTFSEHPLHKKWSFSLHISSGNL